MSTGNFSPELTHNSLEKHSNEALFPPQGREWGRFTVIIVSLLLPSGVSEGSVVEKSIYLW